MDPGQNSNSGRLNSSLTFQEGRSVLLEWIPIIRLGDSYEAQLKLIRDDNNQADQNAGSLNDPLYANNVYRFYSVMAVTRLELFGSMVVPAGSSGQALSDKQDIFFTWTITPQKTGTYEGIVWFYLQFYPVNGDEMFEQAITAQTLDIKVVSLFGIKSNYWRILGIAGLIAGAILLNPFNKVQIKRLRKRKVIKKRKLEKMEVQLALKGS
jgi:hypothetical protein